MKFKYLKLKSMFYRYLIKCKSGFAVKLTLKFQVYLHPGCCRQLTFGVPLHEPTYRNSINLIHFEASPHLNEQKLNTHDFLFSHFFIYCSRPSCAAKNTRCKYYTVDERPSLTAKHSLGIL